jgi:two-component system LytT family response regulator
MEPVKALIIDDDLHTREELKDILEKFFPEVTVLAECRNAATGLEAIRTLHPEIVFLDIEMPDMNGFQMLEKLPEITFEIIFITSFNQYAIKAIRFSALDYLLKPVKVDELRIALQRFSEKSVLGKDAKARITNFFYNAEKQQLADFRLALATTEGMFFLSPNDILYCEGQVNYTLFHLSGKKKMLSSKTLKEYDELLSDHQFIRIHKSYLVNRQHIASITHDHKVAMHDGTLVEISKRKFPEVKMILQNN